MDSTQPLPMAETRSEGAINQRVDVNPNHFVIRDGKLYLFFSDANVVTRDLWKKDAAALVEKADAAYGKLIAQ